MPYRYAMRQSQTRKRDLAGRSAPRFAVLSRPLQTEGAGNAGRPMRPIAVCAIIVVERTHVSRAHRNHPAFPTQWFYGCYVLAPVRRACWPPSPACLNANLTPASGCQAHTSLPSASDALVRSTLSVHRIPPRVCDDRETPLWWDGTGRNIG